jgi:hypothetical protein
VLELPRVGWLADALGILGAVMRDKHLDPVTVDLDQMEREIRAFYRQQRIEDAAWWLTIGLCLAGLVIAIAWVK